MVTHRRMYQFPPPPLPPPHLDCEHKGRSLLTLGQLQTSAARARRILVSILRPLCSKSKGGGGEGGGGHVDLALVIGAVEEHVFATCHTVPHKLPHIQSNCIDIVRICSEFEQLTVDSAFESEGARVPIEAKA